MRGPIRRVNSSEPSEKRPSVSICQLKRSGRWRLLDAGCAGDSGASANCDSAGAASVSSAGEAVSPVVGSAVQSAAIGCRGPGCFSESAVGSPGCVAGAAPGAIRATRPMSLPVPTRCSTMWPVPIGLSTRPLASASLRAASKPASERLGKPNSARAASLAPTNRPLLAKAMIGVSIPSTRRCNRSISGIARPDVSAAAIRIPWLPSGKTSSAQEQVISLPSAAPKPRSRSSRIAPVGGSRPASCAICRRLVSAGPNVFFASAAPLAAPNNRAPTGLAHRTRLPSVDHSHTGSALVACTASRGSPTPCNSNSLWLMVVT